MLKSKADGMKIQTTRTTSTMTMTRLLLLLLMMMMMMVMPVIMVMAVMMVMIVSMKTCTKMMAKVMLMMSVLLSLSPYSSINHCHSHHDEEGTQCWRWCINRPMLMIMCMMLMRMGICGQLACFPALPACMYQSGPLSPRLPFPPSS